MWPLVARQPDSLVITRPKEFGPGGYLYVSRQVGTGRIDVIDPTGAASLAATLTTIGVGQITISGTTLFVRDGSDILKYTINPDHSLTQNSFTLSFTGGMTGLDSAFRGLAFGSDGFLYADERRLNNSPGLNATNNTDWVVRIDPTSGTTSRFVFAGINSFNGSNPTFLAFSAPVPEPPDV